MHFCSHAQLGIAEVQVPEENMLDAGKAALGII